MPETLHNAYQRVISVLEKGTKLIVIDPRETELAKKSDVWVQLRPGSDLALALGMIHVIIDEDLFDRAFVDKWTIGFNRLKNHVSGYPPEKVETITWVPSEKIRQASPSRNSKG
ncbi:Acetylene hydratase [subsurface metagenome]